MKNLISVIFILPIFFGFNPTQLDAQSNQEEKIRGLYIHIENTSPGSVLTTAQQILSDELDLPNTSWKKSFKTRSAQLDRIYTIEFNEFVSVDKVGICAQRLNKLSGIQLAEVIPVYQSFYTPNDLDPDQYNLNITQALEAWDLSQGDENIKIAITDDAFRMDHEDLQNTWAVNDGEIPGNGIDDDGNGFIDDVSGWDAADQDNDPSPPLYSNTDWTHGTHVAGIAGADTDNGIGIAAMGFNVSMIPVKNTNTSPAISHGYEAVDYAINSGAQVINMSWGGPQSSAAGQALMNAAADNGIICVAAAGNNNSSVPMYPCSFDNVFCVGATDANDVRAVFSNYGPNVDVMAPGVDILSCLAGQPNAYGEQSGTSMAAPFVAGLCGLMLSQNPMLSPDEVQECIESTCDNINNLNPSYIGQIGAGRVNALQAMICVSSVYAAFESDAQFQCPGGQVQFSDMSMNEPTSWNWTFPGGNPASSNAQNPLVTYDDPGVYNVTLEVSNTEGSHSVTYNDYIEIAVPQAIITGSTIITDQMDTWLIVEMTGDSPWDIEVSDGTSTTLYENIEASPFQFQVTPDETTTYSIESFSSSNCAGESTGQATVTVIPAPEAINCYFTNIYGDEMSNNGRNIVVDPTDFSIYACGNHDGQAMLSHFNPDGSLDWSRTYDGAEGARGIVRAPNGDLVFVTSDNQSGYKLIRTNSSGDVLWSKEYGWGFDRYPQLTRTLGDTYLIAGWTNYGGTSDNLVVIKVDNNGDLLWNSFFDHVDDQMSSVVPTDDGGCMITGGLHIVGGNLNYFFVRIDSDGNTVFKKEYDSHPIRDDNPTSWLLSDGGYVIAGQTLGEDDDDLYAFISKLDANLEHEWSYRFGGGNGDEYAFDLREDSQNNIVACFRMRKPGELTKALFLKLDMDGNLIWAKHQPDMPMARIEYSNAGSFVISGSVVDSAQFGMNDGIIIHEDEDFSSCFFLETSVDLVPIEWTGTEWPADEYEANATITDLNVYAQELDYNEAELCPLDCEDPCDAEADFTLEEDVLCAPGLVDITTNSSGQTIEWALDGEIIASGTNNPQIEITEPGIHTITLLITNDECTAIHNESVSLSPIEFELGEGGTICTGDSIEISAVVQDGIDFYWSPSSGLADSQAAQTLAAPASSTTYTAHFTDSTGCEATAELIITVDPTCCVSWPEINYDPGFCVGDEIVFENNTNTTGTPQWSWDWPGGLGQADTEGAEPTGVIGETAGQWLVVVQLDDDCGTATDTLAINVFNPPVANAGNDTLLCNESGVIIGGTPMSYHTYTWSPEEGLNNPDIANPFASPSEMATFYLTVEDQVTGCRSFDSVSVAIDFPLELGADYHGCKGDTLHLSPRLVPGDWYWSDGSTQESLAIFESGTYSLEYSNACGTKTDFIEAEFEDCACPVYVPNAFTPNGDGVNDIFKPVVDCTLKSFKFEIVNRQGELVFSSNDPENGWLGDVEGGDHYLQNEVYIWSLELTGELYPARSTRKLNGHVTVIR